MKVERLNSGKYTAFCPRCRYGIIQQQREVFKWAVQHQAKHQKGGAQ